MTRYNKLWVAVAGALVELVDQLWGIKLAGALAALVPALTALGVWAVPNK